MSQKVAKFASYITQPLNIYNFQIKFVSIMGGKVLGDDNVLYTVQSAQFPSEMLRSTTLIYQGQKIEYPAKPDTGGDWKITIPEGDGGQVRKVMDKLKHSIYNQKSGAMTPKPWFDIIVFQNDLQDNPVFKCVLKGCWLKGRDNTDLKTDDVTSSWSNNYTFRYTWIQDDPNDQDAPNNQRSADPFTGQ